MVLTFDNDKFVNSRTLFINRFLDLQENFEDSKNLN